LSRKYTEEEIGRIWGRVERKEYTDEEIRMLSKQSEMAIRVLFQEMVNLRDRVTRLEAERPVISGAEEIELRVIPDEEALELVKSFIDDHPGCLTSDIIFGLQLDPDVALRALSRLEEERRIRGDQDESKLGH